MNDSSQPDPQRVAAAREGTIAGAQLAQHKADSSLLQLGAAAVALLALAALALAGWQGYDSRREAEAVKQELAKKLAEADIHAKESRLVAEQVREATSEAQVKIGILENKLAESQNQQIALEALYQELSRNRDEWAYA